MTAKKPIPDPNAETEAAADESRAAACPQARESLRSLVDTAAAWYGGLAEASAEGARAFRDELDRERVTSRGLAASLASGIVQGNARFVEGAAKATQHVIERHAPAEPGA